LGERHKNTEREREKRNPERQRKGRETLEGVMGSSGDGLLEKQEQQDEALLSSLGVTSANAEDIERTLLAQVRVGFLVWVGFVSSAKMVFVFGFQALCVFGRLGLLLKLCRSWI
jgi:hypothetical protein